MTFSTIGPRALIRAKHVTELQEAIEDLQANPAGGGGSLGYNPEDYGAIADGSSHPLSEVYATLATAQVVYPHAVALTDQIDWAAFQAAMNAALATVPIGMVEFAGHYVHNRPVAATPPNGTDLVGLNVRGIGRGSSTITQTADDDPIFTITGTNIHSVTYKDFTGTWSTAAASAKTDRIVIRGDGVGNWYNGAITDITMTNGHYVVASTTQLIWGQEFARWQVTDGSGGAWSLTGAAGQPNCKADSIYVSANAMIGPIFAGNALAMEMDAIEVNQALLGPKIISDLGGGDYVIGRLGIEIGVYTGNMGVTQDRLFHVSGSIVATQIYAQVEVTGGSLYLFVLGGNRMNSWGDIGTLRINVTGAGAFYVGGASGDSGDNSDPEENHGFLEFGRIRHYGGSAWASSPARILTDQGSTTHADTVRVREWADLSRVAYRPDAAVTLTVDSPPVNIFRTLTANRTISLPWVNYQYSGRPFVVVKDTTSQTITIQTSGGATVATLAAASKGRVTVVYNRSLINGPSFGWSVVEHVTWT